MKRLLTEREVSQLMKLLTEEQQEFILRNSKQSKKAKWLESLARYKGIDVREEMTSEEIEAYIDDWVLLDVLDCGFGNRDYKCECGMSLRYQYIVHNKTKQRTFGFGESCLANHTTLSVELVKDILNGFHKIDMERDEILIKLSNGELFDIQPYLHLDNIPPLIIEQVSVGLPLLDKQIYRLDMRKEEYDYKKRIEHVMNSMKPEARKAYDSFPDYIQEELLDKMVNNDYVRTLPSGFKDNDIEWLISLGLPILDKHQERISLFIYQQNLQRQAQKQREMSQYKTTGNNNQSDLDYNTFLVRHKSTLLEIHDNEKRLSRPNKMEWEKIKQNVKTLREGGEFDYYSFKNGMTMICMQLGVARDVFLL